MNDVVTGILELGKWMSIGGASLVAIPAVYRAGRGFYDDVSKRYFEFKQRKLTLEHIDDQNKLHKIRTIESNDRGRYPLLVDTDGTIRNPNTQAQFTIKKIIERFPFLEKGDMFVRLIEAAGGWPSKDVADKMIPEQTQVLPELPKSITLSQILSKYNLKPGYHRLVLGETVNPETAQLEPVIGDMVEFVHCIVSGQSGFGKSITLEAWAKQFVMAGDCDVCFVDYGVNTFGMLGEYGLYPIAKNPDMAVALLRVLVQEMFRRQELMEDYPQAKNISDYNEATGENIRPIILFMDETSVLFTKATKELQGLSYDLTSMGRKTSIGVVFGGTDFKVNTLPSEIRGSCGLRMAMHLEEMGLSRSIIRSVEAVNLKDKGRALVRLPGVPGLIEMQCPIVEQWDDLPDKQEQIMLAPNAGSSKDTFSEDQVEQILSLWHKGMKATPIAREIFGYVNSDVVLKVREIVSENDDDDNKNDDSDNDGV